MNPGTQADGVIVVLADLLLTWLVLAGAVLILLLVLTGCWLMLTVWRRHDQRHHQPPRSSVEATHSGQDPWQLSGERLISQLNQTPGRPETDLDEMGPDDDENFDDEDPGPPVPW